MSPERTADGRYIVVDGRRWRATDPSIPDPFRKELVSELMAARRAVKDAPSDAAVTAARARVQDAKVALGERGTPWWEEPDEDALRGRISAALRTMLRKRGAAKTVCPSDIARIVGSPDWRGVMDSVRQVAVELAREGQIQVMQRGRRVPDPAATSGPLRYGAGPALTR